ncbi:MAG TPA: DUF1592 domain-containing protein [Bryobacteraceae bacterium]|nr:DUF1592 domain-containing protein [Bryobacteraceae bacterium]
MAASSGDAQFFQQKVKPFLAGHCLMCHNAKARTANLNLEAYSDAAAVERDPAVWEHVLRKLQTGQMPPKGLPRPDAADVRGVTEWIRAALDRPDANHKPDPGRLTAHRLNRFEYNNSVHDLLGVNFRPADDFPADDSGYGFDNIGDVLSLSPVLLEKYLAAAQKVATMAIVVDTPVKPTLARLRVGAHAQGSPILDASHAFPRGGDYDILISLSGPRPKGIDQPLQVSLALDGKQVKLFEQEIKRDQARMFEVRVHLTAGQHQVKAAILRDGINSNDPDPKFREHTQVDYIDVRGPYNQDPAPLPPGHWKIFVCGHAPGHHQPECARYVVANLARRAWRGPVSDQEVDRLLSFVDMARQQGDPFEQGIRVALEAILVSPRFLFRIERDPGPAAHPVSEFELASRLSYFLWSSIPDEELFHAAASGTLRRPEVLDSEVLRMLRDPKSSRLVDNFAGQWLELRNLDSVKPDPEKFAVFNDDLRRDMRQETRLFFDSIVKEDRSILDFIDARYTFLNARLARLYGIAGIEGNQFRRVALTGDERGGVLTQASVLTVTSYPNRTSPVLRGKFLLENILDDPPPPPPPDAGSLDESQINVHGTVRQQFEQHRSKPVCASCHMRMDPLGFAFENYDAIGRWRTHEGKFPVDASGTLPDGRSFAGAGGLKAILRKDAPAFARCLTEKMLTYALGRGLEPYDRPAIQQICNKMAEENYRFSSLILGIVHSLPFQMGRGEAVPNLTASQSPGPPGGDGGE